MPTQDTLQLKEKIISILKKRGPSLPVHIANETQQSILFASAFLSELISERKIKTSFMRVGSSPLYLLPNQEHHLEKFADHLKSKEKDAFILLKQKKCLADSKQDPAIRVALRQIKDFAIPFKKNEEIFFRYFKIPESELSTPEVKMQKLKKEVQIKPLVESKELEIFDNPKTLKKTTKKLVKKKISSKKTEKFFNIVKEFLSNKYIEILDIESFNKNDLILRVNSNNQEKLLIAYNKKRINESDIIKASKKAQESNLPYIILSLGGPLKKLDNLINAVKNLEMIEKL